MPCINKAYSANHAMLVVTFAGPSTSDADYGEVVDALKQVQRDANGRVAFVVIAVSRDHAAPSAHWRSRFADVHRNLTARYLLALVTDNQLIRGVFTAVNWSSKPNSTRAAQAHCAAAGRAVSGARWPPICTRCIVASPWRFSTASP